MALPKATLSHAKIWCLLSVDNNYDQPDNNLVKWWVRQPSLRTLAFTLVEVEAVPSTASIAYVGGLCESMLKGDVVRINETDYRLEEVEEGAIYEP